MVDVFSFIQYKLFCSRNYGKKITNLLNVTSLNSKRVTTFVFFFNFMNLYFYFHALFKVMSQDYIST